MSKEVTFCIIKPDSVKNKNIAGILSHLEVDFEIVCMKKTQLTQELCETFYNEHKERPFFSSLIEFMTSGPIVALALRKEDGVSYLRKIMGATNPAEAAPNTLRKLFGSEIEKNAIHGSDSLKSAERELSLFFPEVQF